MAITIITAFIAGLVSFLAPCVLPIIPGFLAYLGGATVDAGNPKRKEVFLNSVAFVLGFSIVFALLGLLLNTILKDVAYGVQVWLSRFGGAVIIVFGLYLATLIRLPFLEKGYQVRVNTKVERSRYITSFLFGLAFAAGWTPCVGPVLGVILGLAASAPGTAFSLLLSYSLGLGIPFLLVGFFTTEASNLINRYAGAAKWVNIVFGVILIILGVLVFTGKLSLIADFEFINQIIL